jgi:DNA-binding transcriptional regulator YhcF (GntR family)
VQLQDDEPWYQQIYDHLKAQILSGELTGRVPSAKSLTQEYGPGRATTERVLRMLRDEGLIRAVPGKGYWTVRKDKG